MIYFNTKGEIDISLPITKKQFEGSIPDFINKYRRLPFLREDDVEIEVKNDDGEIEKRPYRANRYINEYYGSQDNMVQELFDTGIISYKTIAKILGLTETVVKNAITLETKNPKIEVRRRLHIFFNKDFYEKELGRYNDRCQNNCSRRCKQYYFSDTYLCSKYKAKKKK